MSNFQWIDETSTHVYAANQFGVISYDREDESIDDLTKVDQLTETNLTSFACSPERDVCIVGYENGNLDIIRNGNEIVNQPAVTNSNVIGDKSINQIVFDGSEAMVLSGIGLVRLDLESQNVLDFSPFTSNSNAINTRRIQFLDEAIMLVADQGVFWLPRSELFLSEEVNEVPFEGDPASIFEFTWLNGELYALERSIDEGGDTLHLFDGNAFVPTEILGDQELRHIEQKGDEILVTHRDRTAKYSTSFQELATIFTYSDEPGVDANYARFGRTDGEILIADGQFGGIISSFENQFSSTIIRKSSPQSGVISVVQESEGVIYAMSGGSEFTFNPPFLHQFSDESWSSEYVAPEGVNMTNPVDIVSDGDVKYMVFDRSGLVFLDQDNNITEHIPDESNQIEDDVDGYYGIVGIEMDDDDNLWMLNNRTTHTLSVLTSDGNWGLINIPDLVKPIVNSLVYLSNGMLAFSPKDDGIILYDPNGTPTNMADDRYVHITSSPSQGNLPNSTVYCMVEDHDGELWIGTGEGIAVIFNVDGAFDENFTVDRIIVNQDGFNGYLFETDAVIALEVDGANRKWVSPSGAGLFLMSSDGQTELAHFTEEDSPLLNNNITDLAIHPASGELFICTESGLQSYRGDASEPAKSLGEIAIFPNPVKPGYGGAITFSGLTDDSYLRVTDSSGNLVFETSSRGGTAIWDGNGRDGSRVRSGVYLIYAAERNGANGSIAKLMVLN